MAKHFTESIDDEGVFTYGRDAAAIASEAGLDGLYGVRTRLPQSELDGPGTVRAWKRLGSVERAFRRLNPCLTRDSRTQGFIRVSVPFESPSGTTFRALNFFQTASLRVLPGVCGIPSAS